MNSPEIQILDFLSKKLQARPQSEIYPQFYMKNTPSLLSAQVGSMVGVRGMPERYIESLGVMGWGLEAARTFFRRRRRRRRPPNLVRLQHKDSYYVLSKTKMLLFGRGKGPCGSAAT